MLATKGTGFSVEHKNKQAAVIIYTSSQRFEHSLILIKSHHVSACTCSSWRCHTGWPPSRRSTRCSTTGSRPRRSGTASPRSSPANSKMVFCFVFCSTQLRWRSRVFFKWRLDTDRLGCCNDGKRSSKTPVSLTRYLAFQTKTAFKQRVLNSNLGWATRQAKIWKSKWSTPRGYNEWRQWKTRPNKVRMISHLQKRQLTFNCFAFLDDPLSNRLCNVWDQNKRRLGVTNDNNNILFCIVGINVGDKCLMDNKKTKKQPRPLL